MKEKELLIDLLKSLLELVEENNEELKEEIYERRLEVEIKRDFNDFFKWALGLDDLEGIDIKKTKERWKELHPDLPVPRVCSLEIPPTLKIHLATFFFIMDAHIHYLKEKEKE